MKDVLPSRSVVSVIVRVPPGIVEYAVETC
jgi:hypothetical protein